MGTSTRGMIVWLAIVSLVVLMGCREGRDPHGREALTGAVVFEGQPLHGGSIKFLPEQANGLSAGALVREGKYQIPREQGLVPGTYRVLISALEPAPKFDPTVAPGSDPVQPEVERIPAEYNVSTRQKIEVKAGQANTFDFTIK